MDEARIHCYGCQAVVAADPCSPEQDLRDAGWTPINGETYCPSCARARSLPKPPPLIDSSSDSSAADEGAFAGGSGPPPTVVEPAKPHGRESAVLGRIGERAKHYVAVGVIASIAGVLLFAGLSSTSAGVIVGVIVAIGCPLALLWDERAERLAKQAIGVYLALAGFWLVAFPLSHGWGVDRLGAILGWIDVLIGPAFIWTGVKTARILPLARDSLDGPAFDVRLEIKVLRAGIPNTVVALLWDANPAISVPLARFGWELSDPRLIALDKVPARVYGTPTGRAVVVASCPETVLVGRVKRSRFGESSLSLKPPSAFLAWLWKPRSLRIH